jgi:hypothetical protein
VWWNKDLGFPFAKYTSRWYNMASVQTAFVSGVFLIVAMLVLQFRLKISLEGGLIKRLIAGLNRASVDYILSVIRVYR